MSAYISRKISNFEQFHAIFSQWGGRFEQMSRGNFNGSLDLYVGRKTRAFQAHTSLSILTRGEDTSPTVTLIPITHYNTNSTWQGKKLDIGQMIIKGPEVAYFNRTAVGSTMQALQVPLGLLHEVTEIFSGSSAFRDLKSWTALTSRPDRFNAFNQSLQNLLFHLKKNPHMDTSESHYLEEQSLRLLADMIGKPEKRKRMDFRERNELVHNVIDYLYQRRHMSVSAMDICRDFNISDRSLRRAFKMTLGMGPLSYFRIMRMHAVRGSIMKHGQSQSLMDIYQTWGFNRLGAFAGDYRELFGESPKQTAAA